MTLPYLLMLALAQAAMPPQTPATVDGAGSPTFSIPRVAETVVIDGRLVKVLIWYDNEYGYAFRMVEPAAKVAA